MDTQFNQINIANTQFNKFTHNIHRKKYYNEIL